MLQCGQMQEVRVQIHENLSLVPLLTLIQVGELISINSDAMRPSINDSISSVTCRSQIIYFPQVQTEMYFLKERTHIIFS